MQEEEEVWGFQEVNISTTSLGGNVTLTMVTYETQVDEGRFDISRVHFLEVEEGLLELFQRVLDALQDRLRQRNILLDTTRITVQINGSMEDGRPFRISIPERNFFRMDGRFLLEQIQRYLNSSEALNSTFQLKFAVLSQQEIFPALFGLVEELDAFQQELRKSKYVIQVYPEVDHTEEQLFCLLQSCLIGMAHLYESRPEWPQRQLLEGLFLRSYWKQPFRQLTKFGNRFKVREEMTQRLWDLLNLDTPNDLELVAQGLKRRFGVNVIAVVQEKNQKPKVLYPCSSQLPLEKDPFNVYLLVCLGTNGETHHADCILNPYGFYRRSETRKEKKENQGKWCDRCCQIVLACSCSGDCLCHVCKDVCPCCLERNQAGYLEEHCTHCGYRYCSQDCKRLHDQLFGSRCGKMYEVQNNQKKKEELLKQHVCKGCQFKGTYGEMEYHECFIHRTKLKEANDKILVYDFECCLDENQQHVPYLATAWVLYRCDVEENLSLKYPSFIYGEHRIFVFWGLPSTMYADDGVNQFFHFLKEPALYNFQCFAHNARGYDNVFIKDYFAHRFCLSCDVIRRGQKLLVMTYKMDKKNVLVFKDSLNFIVSTLRSMAGDFGVEEIQKGHFPHRLMSPRFVKELEQTGGWYSFPERDVFDFDFGISDKAKKEKEHAEQWFEEESRKYSNQLWNCKQDAIDYCVSDTVLLGKVLQLFRKENEAIGKEMGISKVFDPLAYTTLPSAIMRLYLSEFLPEQTIGIIYEYPILVENLKREWLLFEEIEMGYNEEGLWIERDQLIPGTNLMNCLLVATKEVFWFVDCHMYGCPSCYPMQHESSSSLHETFGYAYNRYLKERITFAQEGYQVHDMWLCEWTRRRKNEPLCHTNGFKDKLFTRTKLVPRDAYKGGKSESYLFYYQGDFEMSDFVSQYPTVLMGTSICPYTQQELEWYIPTGIPEIHTSHCIIPEEEQVCGIAKVSVLPPSNLYIPFLGFKVDSLDGLTEELLYGLCRTCMRERQMTPCQHSETQRVIHGTWLFAELRYAKRLGYTITYIYETWTYPSSSTTLFRDFIAPLLKIKICSSKKGLIVNNQFTPYGEQVRDYLATMGFPVTESDFVDNPAKKLAAKYNVNSFTGKWGQKSINLSTASFFQEQFAQLLSLLRDNRVSIYSIEYFSKSECRQQDLCILNYEVRLSESFQCATKNDIVIAKVTASGRIMLNQLEQRLSHRLMYVDTDCGVHIKASGTECYTPGFRIGDLEPEMRGGKIWCSTGRKQYGYEKQDQTQVIRQKGVRLNLKALQLFSLEKMLQMVQQVMCSEVQEKEEEILVPQVRFRSCWNRESGQLTKETRQEHKRIRMRREGLKRIPKKESELCIRTFPFGYSF